MTVNTNEMLNTNTIPNEEVIMNEETIVNEAIDLPGALRTQKSKSTFRPRYGRIVDASAYSGLSVSTIRRLLADGRLTAHKVGGMDVILIDLQQLESIIQPAN